MGKFIPVFNSERTLQFEQMIKKEFDLCFQIHQAFFESFDSDVTVHFGQHGPVISSIVGNFPTEEIPERIKKIQGLLDIIMETVRNAK